MHRYLVSRRTLAIKTEQPMGRANMFFERVSRNANIHANLSFMRRIKKYTNILIHTNAV